MGPINYLLLKKKKKAWEWLLLGEFPPKIKPIVVIFHVFLHSYLNTDVRDHWNKGHKIELKRSCWKTGSAD